VRIYDTNLNRKDFEKKYSDPIAAEMKKHNIGNVLNSYTVHESPMTKFMADYVIITIGLNDLEKGLPILKNFLKSQNFPKNSEISYIKLNKVHTIKIKIS
jgi:lysophospholipase L1-like esterase